MGYGSAEAVISGIVDYYREQHGNMDGFDLRGDDLYGELDSEQRGAVWDLWESMEREGVDYAYHFRGFWDGATDEERVNMVRSYNRSLDDSAAGVSDWSEVELEIVDSEERVREAERLREENYAAKERERYEADNS
jgi:hypothetical protein